MAVLINGNEIVLSGMVGDDFWGDGFTASQVISALAQIGRDAAVTIRINSGGGYATEGAAIHAAIKAHKGSVTIVVEGIAASAASLIAVAGDVVQMSLGAVMMIHDPATWTFGTAAEHQLSITMLESLASSYALTYADKTGGTSAAMRELMRAETWLNAEQAIAQKFADAMVAANSNTPAEPTAFAYALYAKAPQPIVALADARGWKPRTPKLAAASAAPPAAIAAPIPAPAAVATPQEPNMANTQNETDIRADERKSVMTRIKAIVNSDEAQGREAMASHLAYETDTSADQAIALMKVAPKASASEGEAETAPDASGQAFATRKNAAADGLGGPTAPSPNAAASAREGWKKAVATVNRGVRK